ncbi:hypothetical protein [Pseudomonas sp. TMP25]|uniref:hypothetical protein n=1 Tax=Pseudomonas sp. TMP25 TaxID=3136561 RepID=UPI003100F1A3
MPLHDCPHTFEQLAAEVLPTHMQRMREALANAESMENFCKSGVGIKTLLKNKERHKDFSGCYTLIEGNNPIYVGISRGVIGRLKQHVCGKTHFDASLAFRIAMAKHPDQAVKKLTRSEAMQDTMFGTSFYEAQTYLKTLTAAFIEITNPLELYVFEAYCAIELDTHQWNSFETH